MPMHFLHLFRSPQRFVVVGGGWWSRSLSLSSVKTTTSATRRDRNLFIFDIFFVGG